VRGRPAKAAVGRADLLRMAARLPAEEVAAAAARLGFGEVRREVEGVRAPEVGPDAEVVVAARPARARVPDVSTPMRFWRLEEMTFVDDASGAKDAPRPVPVSTEGPLTDEDLESPGCSILPAHQPAPLARWSRLWPALRSALQAEVPARDPDVAALVRAWGRGEAVRRIPRLRRKAWAGRASIWVDWSPRLVPFWADQVDVCRRLLDACGRTGVELRILDVEKQAAAVARRGDMVGGFRGDAETPVLLLGDLGVYGLPAEQSAWRTTARRLARDGVRTAALVPSPPARWDMATARAWSAVPWERGRQRGAAVRRDEGYWKARAERLLRLASPAALVQPGLLRELRMLLPAGEADAGTEVDALRHAWVRAGDMTGLVLHADVAVRLREAFAAEEPADMKQRVSEAIRRWREGLPRELLRVETLAWLGMAGGVGPPGDVEDARRFAGRMETSARRAAAGVESKRDAVMRRFGQRALSAMPAGVYAAVPALQVVWARAFGDAENVRVPEGLDAIALRAVLRQSREAKAEPRWWAIRQMGREVVLKRSPNGAWPSQERGVGSPVAWMVASGPDMAVRYGEDESETVLTLQEGLAIGLRLGEHVRLRTDQCTVTLGTWDREAWAAAAGRDEYGLWAEADVEGVGVKFRWIPPGRFMMGSPVKEVGRLSWEGPQHMVTWTQGWWITETQVTQALWKAVMGKNPSWFQSPDRPVEQVSWEDCRRFLRDMHQRLPNLRVRLPSEAEWEHACRAGAETATWLGDLETHGENDAPLLDPIAWYGGNCGVGFELNEGADITGALWLQKQYDDTRGGTHTVGRRDANPLGLFDMLGNVYEWCGDAVAFMDGYADGDVIDPPPARAGRDRVIRGGSWRSGARLVRAAYRLAGLPGLHNDDLGFRLVRGQGSRTKP